MPNGEQTSTQRGGGGIMAKYRRELEEGSLVEIGFTSKRHRLLVVNGVGPETDLVMVILVDDHNSFPSVLWSTGGKKFKPNFEELFELLEIGNNYTEPEMVPCSCGSMWEPSSGQCQNCGRY